MGGKDTVIGEHVSYETLAVESQRLNPVWGGGRHVDTIRITCDKLHTGIWRSQKEGYMGTGARVLEFGLVEFAAPIHKKLPLEDARTI